MPYERNREPHVKSRLPEFETDIGPEPFMRLAIINRFYPPDRSMTGKMAAQLALGLRDRFPDWPITVLTTERRYRTAEKDGQADPTITIRRLPSRFRETRRISRFAGTMIDGYRLAREACRVADASIALTDPPLLGYWLGRRGRRGGHNWAEWNMDLFPEAFTAAGLVRPGNPVARHVMGSVSRHPPGFRLALGGNQLAHLDATRGTVAASAIWPAGVPLTPAPAPTVVPISTELPVQVGYVGNIGQAHSVETMARIIELAPKQRFRFTIAASGSGAHDLHQRLVHRQDVQFVDYLPHDEMARLQVHLVSLASSWTHLSVPSKAVTAVMAGQPFLFAGPDRSDAWTMLGAAGWRIAPEHVGDDEIHRVLKQIGDPALWRIRHRAAIRLAGELERCRDHALDRLSKTLVEWDRNLASRGS